MTDTRGYRRVMNWTSFTPFWRSSTPRNTTLGEFFWISAAPSLKLSTEPASVMVSE